MTEPDGPDASAAGPAGGSSPDDALTERLVDSRVLHKGRYLEFRIDTIERADGTRAERDIVGHPGAVAILAIDDADQVLLVRQFRLPADRVLLEVPAGTLDRDEATGAIEDPDLAARRELEEETGYRARSWRKLASFWTAPGFASELMHLYLATELEPAHEGRLGPDEDERLELDRLPFAEAVAAAERGEIQDAKSLVALLWLDRLTPATPAERNEAPSASDAGREQFQVRYQVGLREAIDAAASSVRSSPWALVIAALGVGFGLLGLLSGARLEGAFLFIFGLLLASGLVVAPFVAINAQRAPDLVTPPMTVTFGSGGIVYETPRIKSDVQWDLVRRVRESSRYFFFETGVRAFYLPKRALSAEDMARLRRELADAGFGPDGRRVARP